MAEKEQCGFDLLPFAPSLVLGRRRQPADERIETLKARLAEAKQIYKTEAWIKGPNHAHTQKARQVLENLLDALQAEGY